MPRKVFVGAALAVVIAIAGIFFYQKYVNAEIGAARKIAAAAVKTADEAISYADSVDKAAAAHVARVDTIVKYRAAKAPERARIIAASPDVCTPALAAREAELREADSTAAEWRAAYEEQKKATAMLKPATVALAHSTTELVKATGGFWKTITPTIGVGGAAGISVTTRKPDAVIGITLGWKF